MKEKLTPRMTKRTEVLYEYKPRHSAIWAKCRLRLYDNEGSAIVIATELPDNPGMSITNAAELIATKAIGDFGLIPQHTRFIEHWKEQRTAGMHLPERWAELLFSWDGVTAHGARWRPLSKEEIEQLIGNLE